MGFQQPATVRPFPASDAATTPATQPLRLRRRDSLPSSVKTAEARPTKRTPNYIRTAAASPQVISSLIDQLSAISIPAHNHFENLLVGYDDGPSVSAAPSVHTQHSGRNSLTAHDGASVDQTNTYNTIKDQNELHPDDACEPPVIRTSKPPSGLSPLTAPKKTSKPHSLSSYIGRSGSSCSLHSQHSNRSASSFGNISIEVAPPRQPSISSNRSSGESKRSISIKAHKGLMYMSSRERLRQKDTERKRVTVHPLDDIPSHEAPRKAAPTYEDTIKEEPFANWEPRPAESESSRFAQRYPGSNGSPRRLRINLVDGPHGESPSDKGLIPERGSSLKHTESPSRKSKKRRPEEKSRHKSRKAADMATEEHEKTEPETQTRQDVVEDMEEEETDVARRIRELREQKMLRDKLAGKLPMDSNAGAATPGAPRVSSIASSEPSPTSTVSSLAVTGYRVQDQTKAHKVLGISHETVVVEKLTDRPADRPIESVEVDRPYPSATPQTPIMRHSRQRSLSVNNGDDIPLPINYNLAMRTLDEAAPAQSPQRRSSRSPAPASILSKETKSSSDSIKRANSLAVGGRSAIGRRASASITTGKPFEHKHSSSVTDDSLNRLAPPTRAASEEPVVRHNSMRTSLRPDSHSMQLQRKRSTKRWSHPDLPAKAEKEHNEKVSRRVERARASAVQSSPHPIIEERPASLDSIDLDVLRYLDDPRLSQKIRHPQTGRIISFSEVGDPKGFAVFVCVGMGLTRYVMAFYDQLAATLKLRLITPDRPGIGGSQVDPNGTPLSWPGKQFLMS
jgi:hypothetical protein